MDLLIEIFNRTHTITERVNTVTQPDGGYLNPAKMTVTVLGEGAEVLNHKESTNPDLVETAVYYLLRFMLGKPAKSAFNTCLYAALIEVNDEIAQKMVDGITGLEKYSVINAVNLCGFDLCCKADVSYDNEIDRRVPDDATIENIIAMVRRSLLFSKEYGLNSIDRLGFDGGYTNTVRNGFGDLLTEDTIWNFRTSWSAPNEKDTLCVLMYWRLFVHSVTHEPNSVKYIGIFNPRRNEVYRIAVADIPDDLVLKIDRDVI